MTAQTIRTGIVDNDVWSGRSIGQWLSSTGSFHVTWCCANAAEAIQRAMMPSTAPQLMLVDMALDGVSGASVCRKVRERSGSIVLIGMTAYDCSKYRDDLAAAGAQGIVGKECIPRELPALLGAIMRDGTADPIVFEPAAQAHARLGSAGRPALPSLSERELAALRLADEGMTTAQISQRMGVSANSVSTYLRRAASKLGTVGRAATIRKCRDYDLL
ncbi:response regulator transcription factor [Bifidobacterium cuniculi]|uniref:Two-component response regulator n=1 Tax=Bifidobacterium cuniculi TaxID=1688 RepID=A0A087B3C8_9BIFI|nr:response regulator transcription factor [Bifidobacterium cuniculi]KFI65528.1 two-component response regulator [Bifidobacterium cuniculi]